MIDIVELQMLPEEQSVEGYICAAGGDPGGTAWECTPLSCLYDFTGGL
jgi:hypothetical protein